jgi:hypothetical protein
MDWSPSADDPEERIALLMAALIRLSALGETYLPCPTSELTECRGRFVPRQAESFPPRPKRGPLGRGKKEGPLRGGPLRRYLTLRRNQAFFPG